MRWSRASTRGWRGRMEVDVHQVNTGRRLRCAVPMRDGAPETRAGFAIGGVPGTFVESCGAGHTALAAARPWTTGSRPRTRRDRVR